MLMTCPSAARQGYRSLAEAVADLEGLVVQLKRERLLAELGVGAPGESAAANGGHTAAAPAAPLVVLRQAYRRVARPQACVRPSLELRLAICLFVSFRF